MELLGERPVWSMSGAERLATLDALQAELARLETYRLQVISGLDDIGYAQEIGAHDTIQLLSFRYRIDRPEARRDVRLALTLSKYAEVNAALPAPDVPVELHLPGHPTPADPTRDALRDPSENDPDLRVAAENDPDLRDSSENPDLRDAADDDGTEAIEVRLRPAQADAIVSALERVPSTVPAADIAVAEQQLVNLARHLSPGELRKAGQRIRDILDTDGPEPDERKAYDRERLTLSTAPNGVKFRGYLANENAELLRSLVHAGARPHKTIDGHLDPRPRDKRQADALTATLTIAAASYDATTTLRHKPPTKHPHTPALAAPPANHPPSADPPTHNHPPRAPGNPSNHTAPAHPTAHDHTPPAAENPGDQAAQAGAMARDRTLFADGTESGGVAASDGRLGDRVAGEVPGFGAKATITVTIDLQDLQSATADATGELVYGDNLSAAAIRRLACDAKIIPLVLGSNSEPLDVGRSERLVNRAMRRALNARDKGCVVCGAPPIQCDAHHIRSWIDGGPTAVSNLVLLCRRHHIDLHAGDWTITITDGVVHVSRPTWADPPPIRTATPASLQEAATRAIWGTPAPTTRRPPDHNPSPRDPSPTLQPAGALHTAPPFDPWQDPTPTPGPAP